MLDIIIKEKELIQKSISESSGFDLKKQAEDNHRIVRELAGKYNITLHVAEKIES